MPCYQVNLMSVKFHAKNTDLLKETLTAKGYRFVQLSDGRIGINTPRGTMITVGNGTADYQKADEATLNAIRVAYTHANIRRLAQEERMTVIEDPEDPDHLIIRSYG